MSGSSFSASYQSLSDLVSHFESGGNPVATNPDPNSSASGLYGFTNGTWAQYLTQLGGSLSAYPTASSAPASLQTSVFNQAVTVNGLNDWTCPNCDPALVNYLNANPSASSLPVTGGTGQQATLLGQDFPSQAVPGALSGAAGGATGNATAANGGTGSGSAASSCGSLFNPQNWGCALIGSFAGRFLYGLVGIVLIMMALVIYAIRTREEN